MLRHQVAEGVAASAERPASLVERLRAQAATLFADGKRDAAALMDEAWQALDAPHWSRMDAILDCRNLSPREVEVLQLSCTGINSRETGRLLGISVHAVESYRALIFRKLGTNSVVESAVVAVKAGLV